MQPKSLTYTIWGLEQYPLNWKCKGLALTFMDELKVGGTVRSILRIDPGVSPLNDWVSRF